MGNKILFMTHFLYRIFFKQIFKIFIPIFVRTCFHFSFFIFISDLYAYESPSTGDLIFTEIMANPQIGPEWFEIYNTTGNSLNLKGCVLMDGGVKAHYHEINEDLTISPFSFFVFSKGEFPTICIQKPDYFYQQIILSNSGLEELILYCNTENNIIDRVFFNINGIELEKGHSLSLCQGYFNFKANDSTSSWRQAKTSFCDAGYDHEYGTPGLFAPCENVQNDSIKPSSGSIIITEMMITPSKGSVEWFETFNRENKAVDITGCDIVVTSASDTKKQKIIENVVIEPYTYFVMSKSRCIDFLCELSNYVYKGPSMRDSGEGILSIVCEKEDGDSVVINYAIFNYGGQSNTKKGYSVSLKPDFVFENKEFDPEQWCEASSDTEYSDQKGGDNFGTPGRENICGNGELKTSSSSLNQGGRLMSCNIFAGWDSHSPPINSKSFIIMTFLCIIFLFCCREKRGKILTMLPAEGEKSHTTSVVRDEGGNMKFEEVMEKRKSTRKFLKKEIEKEKLDKIFKRLITAPSAGNLQAYRVYVITNQEKLKSLANAAWGQSFIAEAPVVMVFFADPKTSMWKYGDRGKNLYSIQDATIAGVFAWLEVVNQGLSAAWVGAFSDSEVSKVTEAEPDLKPVIIMPVGYAYETPYTTDRKPLEEVIRIKN